MTCLTLHFCPLTCARVTMTALERVGADYDVRVVNIMAGEQRAPDYLAINPGGKVPALDVGGRLLTENVAILLYLDKLFPDAVLLPPSGDPLFAAEARSDLVWCAATLHPIARQIRAPFHYTIGDHAPVQAKGREAIAPVLARLEARLSSASWWFGARWSIIDPYLAWVVATCASAGLDSVPYPAVQAHGARVVAEPAYRRMLEREAHAAAQAGMRLPPA